MTLGETPAVSGAVSEGQGGAAAQRLPNFSMGAGAAAMLAHHDVGFEW